MGLGFRVSFCLARCALSNIEERIWLRLVGLSLLGLAAGTLAVVKLPDYFGSFTVVSLLHITPYNSK